MVIRKQHAGGAANTTLSGGIGSGDTSFSVASGGGASYPDGSVGPFVITIDSGTASEERVLVTSRISDAFSGVTRGYDGTTATTHQSGAAVGHTFSALEADEANAHIMATSAAHNATAITFTPTGNIAATTVQAAIAELDTEKSDTAHTHAINTAPLLMGVNPILGSFALGPTANRTAYVKVRAEKSGSISGLTFGLISAGAGANITVALYSDSAGSPNTRLASGTAAASGTNTAQTVAFSAAYSVVAGTYYWLAMASNSVNPTLVGVGFAGTANSGTARDVFRGEASNCPATAASATPTSSDVVPVLYAMYP